MKSDEFNPKTREAEKSIELKVTSEPEKFKPDTLLPVDPPKRAVTAADNVSLKPKTVSIGPIKKEIVFPTNVSRTKLVFLHQASLVGSAVALFGCFAPPALQLNLIIPCAVAVFAIAVGLSSCVVPAEKLKHPARRATLALILNLSLPFLYLIFCGTFAKQLPTYVLDSTLAGNNILVYSAVMMLLFRASCEAMTERLIDKSFYKSWFERKFIETALNLSSFGSAIFLSGGCFVSLMKPGGHSGYFILGLLTLLGSVFVTRYMLKQQGSSDQ